MSISPWLLKDIREVAKFIHKTDYNLLLVKKKLTTTYASKICIHNCQGYRFTCSTDFD